MDEIRFEWDENKNLINQRKHGISFEEAQSVFYDEAALVIDDPEHSDEEERFIILGLSNKLNLLVVCHCYRESDSILLNHLSEKSDKNRDQFLWELRCYYAERI